MTLSQLRPIDSDDRVWHNEVLRLNQATVWLARPSSVYRITNQGQHIMKHFYRGVEGLGNVAVSRHAQARMEAEGVSQEAFDKALLEPVQPDIPDGSDIVWRERDGLRLVILTKPTPNVGAVLVKTAFRVQRQAVATGGSVKGGRA